MAYCTHCGYKIPDKNANYCVKCGSNLKETPSINIVFPKDKQKKYTCSRKKSLTFIIVIALISLMAFFIFIYPSKSVIVLKAGEHLLGTSCEDILDDDSFSISKSLGIYVATKSTDDLFGIPGKYQIFILPDEEYANIITWEGKIYGKLSDEKLQTLIDGMKMVYGTPLDSSDNSSFLWEKDEFCVFLTIDEKNITILWSE